MGHLTNDEFFTKLADVFNTRKAKAHGAIYLTQKRLSYNTNQTPPSPENEEQDALADLHPSQPLPLLVRATNGKGKEHRAAKVKLSTVVQPDDLAGFYARYAEVCKAGMAALKPRDRTKRKAKAKKRKGGGGGVAPAS
ncbi:signal recognition particle subunit srp14 [Parachaetomium inaequale]|uniref:Signal recognition particle subunit SRP14 n=1 Tax=Parachaetomium inaequale TaxID=2588326 RepID=A0AAN6SSJ4_9PEZI|nr:signal recognition particle subunit srp14 [Parachaetomium inaequale]